MSTYDKFPYIQVKNKSNSDVFVGYENISRKIEFEINKLDKKNIVVAIDFYHGVSKALVEQEILSGISYDQLYYSDNVYFKSEKQIQEEIKKCITDDRVFGIMYPHNLEDFIDEKKRDEFKSIITKENGITVIYGVGATLVVEPDIYIYADLARWEIQQRYRKGMCNWKCDNADEDNLKKFKRGYFFEWRILDKYKKKRFDKFDFLLDLNNEREPKMISGDTLLSGLKQALKQPFRVVPFFDPGVWGGQWMKDVCDLDKSATNYAWSFDGVPEENSLLLKVGDVLVEIPSINLVFKYPKELLGSAVYARFGDEFPIRFDFLDTMEGQNLSLQVHPLTEYIQQIFGMHYTQDESYYILDAKDDASVYLGLKNNVDKNEFFKELEIAQKKGGNFNVEKFVNKLPANKHDHFLIPAGTVHCSGAGTMVLEISATPYIFTFKLWDWGRLGTDNKPRPIHLDHGIKNVCFERDADWTMKELVNNIEVLVQEEGCKVEKTGLHESQFIETHRIWQKGPMTYETNSSVNMLNLVSGDMAIIESPNNLFEPFVVHYAETFIVPEIIKEYIVRPYGNSEEIALIKAYVK